MEHQRYISEKWKTIEDRQLTLLLLREGRFIFVIAKGCTLSMIVQPEIVPSNPHSVVQKQLKMLCVEFRLLEQMPMSRVRENVQLSPSDPLLQNEAAYSPIENTRTIYS